MWEYEEIVVPYDHIYGYYSHFDGLRNFYNFNGGKERGDTWSVNALVWFVTKKLVKLTKYAREELKRSNHKIFESSLASAIVIPTTSSSIIIEAGRRNATATGAMYMRRFIELSFSLRDQRNNSMSSAWWETTNFQIHRQEKVSAPYASEDSKTPWSTVLSALAAVAPMHIKNPNRWKLGSPFIHVRKNITKINKCSL